MPYKKIHHGKHYRQIQTRENPVLKFGQNNILQCFVKYRLFFRRKFHQAFFVDKLI